MRKKLVEQIITEHESATVKIAKEIRQSFSNKAVLDTLKLIFKINFTEKSHKTMKDLDHEIKVTIAKENLCILLEVVSMTLEKRGYTIEFKNDEILVKGLRKS